MVHKNPITQLASTGNHCITQITAQGAIPGSPSDKLSEAQAVLVIEKIASLHAPFWNQTHKNPEYRWLASPVRRLEDHLGSILAAPLMKRGLDKAGHLAPKALHAPAIHYARNRRLAMRFLSQGPQTIIHHDCHPGNLFGSTKNLDYWIVKWYV